MIDKNTGFGFGASNHHQSTEGGAVQWWSLFDSEHQYNEEWLIGASSYSASAGPFISSRISVAVTAARLPVDWWSIGMLVFGTAQSTLIGITKDRVLQDWYCYEAENHMILKFQSEHHPTQLRLTPFSYKISVADVAAVYPLVIDIKMGFEADE